MNADRDVLVGGAVVFDEIGIVAAGSSSALLAEHPGAVVHDASGCVVTPGMIEAGTVAHPERMASGVLAAGLRGTIGTWGWDIEIGPYAAPCDEVLARQRAVVDLFPAGGLVEGWVTLVGHDLASDELLAGAADLARELGTSMTMHLSPTSSDPERYLARR